MPASPAPGIGLLHATFIVVASMLGTGILTTSGMVAQATPDAQWALLAWLAGGIQAILGALCYGAILNRLPISGGEGALLGRFYSPNLGFITGLLSFVLGFAAANAATAMALEAYCRNGLASAAGSIGLTALPSKSIAIVAVIAMTALHARHGKGGMRFQTGLAFGKLAILAGLALAGLSLANPGQVATTLTTPPSQLNGLNSDPLLWMIFAYSGWNAAIYAASEFRSPAVTVPRAMVLGCSLVVTLYLLLNLALFTNLDHQSIAGVIPVMSLLVTRLYGTDASGIFSMLVAVALLSSIGVAAFAGPRVLRATLVPNDGSQRGTVPTRLVWLQGGLTLFFVLSGTFEQVLSLLGFFLGVFPVLTVASLYFPHLWPSLPPSRWIRLFIAPLYLTISLTVLIWSIRGSIFSLLLTLCLIGGTLIWGQRRKLRLPAA